MDDPAHERMPSVRRVDAAPHVRVIAFQFPRDTSNMTTKNASTIHLHASPPMANRTA
jgi:hypothetical protein